MRKVLSVDGGGIRGVLPAAILVALADRGINPASWSLVSGTSTGGIIATGLAAGISPSTILDLYVNHGAEVFSKNELGGLFNAKYSADNLEKRLQSVFGDRRLSNIQGQPELLVPSYCVRLPHPEDTDGDGINEGASSLFFRSWKARVDPLSDWPLWQVCRATSAAPTFFPAARIDAGYVMIDGGVFANNPAMCAIAAVQSLWPGEEIKVLSLGTGTAIAGINAGDWGAKQWVENISSVFMDGQADAVSYQCDALRGSDFLRIDTPITDGVNEAFDDVSPTNIKALQNLAAAVVAKEISRIVEFVQ